MLPVRDSLRITAAGTLDRGTGFCRPVLIASARSAARAARLTALLARPAARFPRARASIANSDFRIADDNAADAAAAVVAHDSVALGVRRRTDARISSPLGTRPGTASMDAGAGANSATMPPAEIRRTPPFAPADPIHGDGDRASPMPVSSASPPPTRRRTLFDAEPARRRHRRRRWRRPARRRRGRRPARFRFDPIRVPRNPIPNPHARRRRRAARVAREARTYPPCAPRAAARRGRRRIFVGVLARTTDRDPRGRTAEQRRRRRARKSPGSVRDGRERGDGGDDVASVVGVDEGMAARGLELGIGLERARRGGARRGARARGDRRSRGLCRARRGYRGIRTHRRGGRCRRRGLCRTPRRTSSGRASAAGAGVYHHRAGRDRDARGRGEMRGAPAARKTGRRAGRSTRATTRLSRATVGPDRRARARRRRSALLAGRIARGEHQRRAATLRDTCALFTRARAKK